MTGSQLSIYGYLEFINNTAVDGAALELLSFGQLAVANGTRALFQGNSGRCVRIRASSLEYMLKVVVEGPQ